MFTFSIIVLIFFVLWVLLYFFLDIKNSTHPEDHIIPFLLSFLITGFGSIIYFYIKFDNEHQHCLETVQPIIPRIVHLEDSSKKILKYYYEGIDREIEIDRTSNNFYLPESLLKIEPCNRTVFVKR